MVTQNIRFINDEARQHYLITNAATAQVYQVFSDRSQGNFYTLEAYITLRNLMTASDKATHTATDWDVEAAAMVTEHIITWEELLSNG